MLRINDKGLSTCRKRACLLFIQISHLITLFELFKEELSILGVAPALNVGLLALDILGIRIGLYILAVHKRVELRSHKSQSPSITDDMVHLNEQTVLLRQNNNIDFAEHAIQINRYLCIAFGIAIQLCLVIKAEHGYILLGVFIYTL